LAQSVELDIEVTDKATRGAVAGKVRVLSAAQVELELDAGDGYKPRDLWLALAASGTPHLAWVLGAALVMLLWHWFIVWRRV
jgi:hypothetical protein